MKNKKIKLKQDINRLRQKILCLDKKKRIKFIYLFGSVADNKNTPLSDIDLAVYYDGTPQERFKFRIFASGYLADTVDLQIFQDLPLPVRKEILKGKMLYYQDYQFVFDEAMMVIKEFEQFEKYYNEYFETLERRALT